MIRLYFIFLIISKVSAISKLTDKDCNIKPNIILNTEIIKNNETQITNSIPPETDIRVAVNPTYPNNLIMVSIQHRLNNSKESYIMPIFYTKDNGRNWNRSIFKLFPNDNFRFSLQAEAPSIGFNQKGEAFLSWSLTYLDTRTPGVDSVFSKLLYAYSKDGGASWQEFENNYLDMSSNVRRPDQLNQGIKTYYESSQIINDTINNQDYFFYLKRKIDAISESEFYLYDITDLPPKLVYSNNSLINNHLDFTRFNCLISEDGNIALTYLAVGEQLDIYFAKINYKEDRLLDLNKISQVNYTGGFYFPGSLISNELGINGSYFSPTPKLIKFDENYHFFWNSSGLEIQEFEHNIYYTKMDKNGFVASPKIINNTYPGFRFNPDVIFIDSTIYLSYFERDFTTDTSSANIILCYSEDFGTSFNGFSQVNYKSTDYNFVGDRNFNYGIGINQGLIANNSHIFQFFPDGRNNNGNLEIYSSQLPLIKNIDDFINSELIDLNIFGPIIENNIFRFIIYSTKQIASSVYITDATGKSIFETNFDKLLPGNNEFHINMSRFSHGTYFFVVINREGTFTKPFIYLE